MRSLRVLALVAVAVVGALALEGEEIVAEDEVTAAEEVEDVVDVEAIEEPRSVSSSGRTLKEWSSKFWKWMGYDYDYDEYDTYYPATASQFGYGLPSVGYVAPSAGGAHSTYSSYVPVHAGHQQFAHPARHDDYEESEWSFTDMLFDMAVTVVPVGILLSALPSGLFAFAIRRRSFDDGNMLMDSLEPTEVNRIMALLKSDLTDRRCQEELFCELSRIGEHEGSSYLQKAFFYISTLTPDFLANRFGVNKLFRTTRSGYCQALQCPSISILEPPKISHQPMDTNHIDEVITEDTENEATEVSKE